MNVSLTPELEKLISTEVRSGHYATASEVVREALRLFQRERILFYINAGIEQSATDLEAGRFTTLDTKKDLNAFEKRIREKGQELRSKKAAR